MKNQYDKYEAKDNSRKFVAAEMVGIGITVIVLVTIGLVAYKWIPVLWDKLILYKYLK